MTKGKKWTLRLLGVAALALLICLCLLGSTMARYTSTGTGSGTLTVALWDLETADVELSADEMTSVSPSDDAYDKTAAARTNTSDWIPAFNMVNNSDVDAYVTLSADSTVTLGWATEVDGLTFTWGTGWTGDGAVDIEGNPVGRAQTNAYGADLMGRFESKDAFAEVVNTYGVFSITLGYSDDGGTNVTAYTGEENEGNGIKIAAKTGDEGTSEAFYAKVVWTSVYDTDTLPTSSGTAWTSWAEYSDAIDTILGMYVETLSFGVTWTAVQASTLPPQT